MKQNEELKHQAHPEAVMPRIINVAVADMTMRPAALKTHAQTSKFTFHSSVLECPLPSKFHLLQLKFYDGTKDLLDHIGAFKTILNLQQKPNEVIYRSFPATLRKAVLEIDEVDNQVIMMTFQARLNNLDLIFSLGKMPPTSMMVLLFKAQKYMNRENALIAKGLTRKWKKDGPGDSHGKKKDCKDSYSKTKNSKSSSDTQKKKMNFTSLVIPANKILM
nr:hypothetical protein CFP56_49464 [Quercus suber]POE99686.1 hypothetical protein CFP56_19015 [Quercus suber]